MEMEIEQNVAVPTSTRARKYPFLEMVPGESIFYPQEKVNGRAYRAAKSTGTRHGQTFVARKEGTGIRIWRKA
jgi:hypothetical protein|tara:strand:+ start:177 stop:395 length:219 start_codon:yes stop_codon:yes gene_type:complete